MAFSFFKFYLLFQNHYQPLLLPKASPDPASPGEFLASAFFLAASIKQGLFPQGTPRCLRGRHWRLFLHQPLPILSLTCNSRGFHSAKQKVSSDLETASGEGLASIIPPQRELPSRWHSVTRLSHSHRTCFMREILFQHIHSQGLPFILVPFIDGLGDYLNAWPFIQH